MPEICRFYGIVIRMYGLGHAPPHMHAVLGGTRGPDRARGHRGDPRQPARALDASSSSGPTCTRTSCARRGSGHGVSSRPARLRRSNDTAATIPPRTTALRYRDEVRIPARGHSRSSTRRGSERAEPCRGTTNDLRTEPRRGRPRLGANDSWERARPRVGRHAIQASARVPARQAGAGDPHRAGAGRAPVGGVGRSLSLRVCERSPSAGGRQVRSPRVAQRLVWIGEPRPPVPLPECGRADGSPRPPTVQNC